MPHGTNKESFMPRSHEPCRLQTRLHTIESIPIYISNGSIRQTLEISNRKEKLVGEKIQEADIERTGDLVQKYQQSQTTFIQTQLVAMSKK
jgi:hypothetical protein